jgi:hypothetical protein
MFRWVYLRMILLVQEEQRFDYISFRVPKQAMNELVGNSSLLVLGYR